MFFILLKVKRLFVWNIIWKVSIKLYRFVFWISKKDRRVFRKIIVFGSNIFWEVYGRVFIDFFFKMRDGKKLMYRRSCYFFMMRNSFDRSKIIINFKDFFMFLLGENML